MSVECLDRLTIMFCPQCATESNSDQRFCRSCGANLKVIGKAVTLSEAIARSDSVPAKIKDLVKNLKIEKVTEEVSRAMDKMNQELVISSGEALSKPRRRRKEKTPEQRREHYLVKGTIKLFWGGGLSLFLYFAAQSLILKLPPEAIAKIPFEPESLVRVLWLIGLIPVFSGLGHIIAALLIRTGQPARETIPREIESAGEKPLRIDPPFEPGYDDEATFVSPRQPLTSVTDRTTNILHKVAAHSTSELEGE